MKKIRILENEISGGITEIIVDDNVAEILENHFRKRGIAEKFRITKEEVKTPFCIKCKKERVSSFYKKGKVCDSCKSKQARKANQIKNKKRTQKVHKR